jgi:hypothetical protein
LRAFDSGTTGPVSDPIAVSTLVSPPAPINVSVTAYTSNAARIAWVDVCTYETGYRVERSLDGLTWTQVGTTGANGSTMINVSLSAHTTYYYRVRAVEGLVVGDPSAVVAYTTP